MNRVLSRPVVSVTRGDDTICLSLSNGYVLREGVQGFDSPTPALVEIDPALWDGNLTLDARYTAREVFLPFWVHTPTTDDLRAVTRHLAVLTDPKRGPVTVTVTHRDSTTRSITGWLTSPLSESLTMGEGEDWRSIGLTVRCGDPYWQGDHRRVTFRDAPGSTEFLSSTFLPLTVSTSQVLGTVTVSNDGDAQAWPVWTITGPADSVTVRVSTGQSWAIPQGINDGDVLTVDTRRGQQAVVLNGNPAWGVLSPGADLFALPPGLSVLDIVAQGTTAATSVTVEWRERWLTAW